MPLQSPYICIGDGGGNVSAADENGDMYAACEMRYTRAKWLEDIGNLKVRAVDLDDVIIHSGGNYSSFDR